MPFCTKCGTQVQSAAAFCQGCGTAQPGVPAPPIVGRDPFSSLKPSTASTLCYAPWVGWIMSLVILSTARFRTDRLVRFHAFQGLYLFVAWMIVHVALDPVMRVSGLRRIIPILELGLLATWILMLVKTSANELIRLPIVGEMADRSVNEQSNSRPFGR